MPGLVPDIHVFKHIDKQVVDGRDKPDHDELYPPRIPLRSMRATRYSPNGRVELPLVI